ncbi:MULTISPECIES: KH domain-containing protein [unclassified Picosynechococcus]|uniref:KH domain-containing protein n=1 Tax=unclassified Picosynechococcus TaxID=3079910 RepID=UPI0004AA75E7|nr:MULTISPECIES: KH domain-containing protein [unclassified Picosynechococcus]AMA08321.1 RNA-binding protein [Picosynechococcus sp. PCC 73109]ANV86461.1 RNA-binding protein [Picosynechococcus sp. PCC 7117]
MSNLDDLSSASHSATANYEKLTKFLLEPLLDDPQSLAIDCEQLSSSNRVLIRVAFEQEDKGKVFGRGGRNLRAIETVLNGAATNPQQKISLDVYGSHDGNGGQRERSSGSSRGRREDGRRGRTSRRPRTPKPSPQLRNSDEG